MREGLDYDRLVSLTEERGVPGYEDRVRDAIAPHVDRVRSDAMGNLVGTVEGETNYDVVAAHMDEIGTNLLAELDRLIPRVHVCQD